MWYDFQRYPRNLHCVLRTDCGMRTSCGLRTNYVRYAKSVALLLFFGCAAGPEIQWSDVSYSAPQRPRGIPPGTIVPSPDACPVSARAVRLGRAVYAVWWTVKSDSSALLVLARSADGGTTWVSRVIADSTDRSVRGCGRPAPAIAADSASGYVHVAYFAEPRSGSGVFFAHSMDSGATFHAAVPVVFGRNPAFVAVAAEGDRVAVAYDDPNNAQPAVGIALSTTMGHIFRAGEIVSNEGELAKQPSVALDGDTIRLWWSDYAPDPRVSATRTAYRHGVWRR